MRTVDNLASFRLDGGEILLLWKSHMHFFKNQEIASVHALPLYSSESMAHMTTLELIYKDMMIVWARANPSKCNRKTNFHNPFVHAMNDYLSSVSMQTLQFMPLDLTFCVTQQNIEVPIVSIRSQYAGYLTFDNSFVTFHTTIMTHGSWWGSSAGDHENMGRHSFQSGLKPHRKPQKFIHGDATWRHGLAE